MAVLTARELNELRKRCAAELGVADFDKATANAALQAIEDWYETNKATGSTDIDTATTAINTVSPYTFSAPQKKILFQYWNFQKFNREKET
jgi:hypothetical protein